MNIKKIFAALILLVVCGYATWREMQTLAIVTILLFLSLLYINQVKVLFELFLAIISRTKQAKFGSFELSIGDTITKALLTNIESDEAWVNAIVADLTPTHLALLIAIYKAGQFHCNDNIKPALRDLRNKGLIKHDKETLANSDTVWLTQTGIDLVNEILQPAKTHNDQSKK